MIGHGSNSGDRERQEWVRSSPTFAPLCREKMERFKRLKLIGDLADGLGMDQSAVIFSGRNGYVPPSPLPLTQKEAGSAQTNNLI